MATFDIYADIAKRAGGDIYIGVVGPVRTGKSTFISSFMKNNILPIIQNINEKERIIDEIPQSADGKTVMTTQPRFVPSKSCKLNIAGNIEANFRLVDCVGYMVNGAKAGGEDGKERMVKTPWTEEEIEFSKAAEIGTKKVITNHATVGIVLTSDGTIATEIPRNAYIEAEERCVSELKELGKPFVVVINSATPDSEQCERLTKSLKAKYDVPVFAVNSINLTDDNIETIFKGLLSEFPIQTIDITLPAFLEALPINNPFITEVIDELKQKGSSMIKMGDFDKIALFETNDNFEPNSNPIVKMDEGRIVFTLVPKPHMFYKVISMQAGQQIDDEFELISCLAELSTAKTEYDKIKAAMENARESGYGIVKPVSSDLQLDEPQILKQGNKFGVKLKATAPSFHILKIDVETEVNPILGTEQQSQLMVNEMMEKFQTNPQDLWETNIFGKDLNSLAMEGLESKITSMPEVAQTKLRKTTQRIVNEGKGGVICILL